MFIYYGTALKWKYEGRKVVNMLQDYKGEYGDLTWHGDKDDPVAGEGRISFQPRSMRDEDENDPYYGIIMETGVRFRISKEHKLETLKTDIRLYHGADLGKIATEDEWKKQDFEDACRFFEFLVGE